MPRPKPSLAESTKSIWVAANWENRYQSIYVVTLAALAQVLDQQELEEEEAEADNKLAAATEFVEDDEDEEEDEEEVNTLKAGVTQDGMVAVRGGANTGAEAYRTAYIDSAEAVLA
jgi:hypothetical protein